MSNSGEKLIAKNSSAFRDFAVLESLECGIELMGPEVKSLREARTNLKDSFARIDAKEIWLYNMHISPYEQASHFNLEPTRRRRLLLHKKEILRLEDKVRQKGLALVPLRLYFKKGRAKVELALVKGKRLYDKRTALKKKQLNLEVKRTLRRQNR
ncbi:SsrA-binding protein SmpB [Candidatus Omnitrophota bacterium]